MRFLKSVAELLALIFQGNCFFQLEDLTVQIFTYKNSLRRFVAAVSVKLLTAGENPARMLVLDHIKKIKPSPF